MLRKMMVLVLLAGLFYAPVANANVSLQNGNFFMSYTDAVHPGGFDMKIERIYNSKSNYVTGKFGLGWGMEEEVYLEIVDAGAVIVHEYGGGAENEFRSNDFHNLLLHEIDRIVEISESQGLFSSDDEKANYRKSLEESYFRREAVKRFKAQGLMQRQDLPEGTELSNNRFGHQRLIRRSAGYERRLDNGDVESFDDDGHLVRIANRNGNTIGLRYDDDGRLAEMADDMGRVFDFSYNDRGLVTNISDGRGHSARYDYDDKSRLVHSVDVSGGDYKYEYDNMVPVPNMTAIRYSDNTSMEMSYYTDTSTQNIKSLKDRDGTLTEYKYTDHDKLDSQIDVAVRASDGTEINNSRYEYFKKYDEGGRDHVVRLVTTINGDVTDTTYTADGYPAAITTSGGTTHFQYDSQGHVLLKETPTEKTVLTYDSTVGKVSSVIRTGPGGDTSSKFAYDPKGNLITAVDSHGHHLALTYDLKGRIAAVSDHITVSDPKASAAKPHSGANGDAATRDVTLRFTYNENSKPLTIGVDGLGEIHLRYAENGEIKKVDADGGRDVALRVTTVFQDLLDVIRPAGVSLNF